MALSLTTENLMCAAFELNDRVIRPGKLIRYWQTKIDWNTGVWAGFARKETMGWWKKQGWQPIDIPAEKFAERSEKTGELIWDEVPAGLILRGVLDVNAAKPILKVVTRASTESELERFQHPRMPLLELPLFNGESLGVEEEKPKSQNQPELF